MEQMKFGSEEVFSAICKCKTEPYADSAENSFVLNTILNDTREFVKRWKNKDYKGIYCGLVYSEEDDDIFFGWGDKKDKEGKRIFSNGVYDKIIRYVYVGFNSFECNYNTPQARNEWLKRVIATTMNDKWKEDTKQCCSGPTFNRYKEEIIRLGLNRNVYDMVEETSFDEEIDFDESGFISANKIGSYLNNPENEYMILYRTEFYENLLPKVLIEIFGFKKTKPETIIIYLLCKDLPFCEGKQRINDDIQSVYRLIQNKTLMEIFELLKEKFKAYNIDESIWDYFKNKIIPEGDKIIDYLPEEITKKNSDFLNSAQMKRLHEILIKKRIEGMGNEG